MMYKVPVVQNSAYCWSFRILQVMLIYVNHVICTCMILFAYFTPAGSYFCVLAIPILIVLLFSSTRLSIIPVTFLEFFIVSLCFFPDSFSHVSPMLLSFVLSYLLLANFFPSYSTYFLLGSLHFIPGIFHNIPVFPLQFLLSHCS
jgi:hypothetical protein